MDPSEIAAVFQPRPSKLESKADLTTKIARQILDDETAKREAKTERLRLARLAQEPLEPAKSRKVVARNSTLRKR
ncbi:hypothetical protein [Pseudaminobacter sp. NGMCC 1.201702]|uniref:hypothetical protein n=1 Tax=Pseudaminobacter sp. NGMCC 1.201702 TaxID=3391825 RepID=UPI0039EE4AAA